MSGLATSTQTNSGGGTTTNSPFQPVVSPEIGLINNEQVLAGTNSASQTPQEATAFNQAQTSLNNANQTNLGPDAALMAQNIFNTSGDPYGLLAQQRGNLNPIANMGANNGAGLDPRNAPGMQGVLGTIQNDVQNSVNSQFAGAGRSLSGLNQQAIARGLGQGEAQPLLAQYNQNVQNMQQANQGLGQVGGQYNANTTAGGALGMGAPGLATANPLAQVALGQQQTALPYQNLAQQENILNPIAGLGGTQVGSTIGAGTATASPLSAAGQIANIGSSIGGLFGGIL